MSYDKFEKKNVCECERHRAGLCYEHDNNLRNLTESAEFCQCCVYSAKHQITCPCLFHQTVTPSIRHLFKHTLSTTRICIEDAGARVADCGETEYRDLFPGRMIKSVAVSNVLNTFTSRTYSCEGLGMD